MEVSPAWLVAGKRPVAGWVLALIAGQGGACCSKEPGEVGDSQKCLVVPGGGSLALLVGVGS